MPDLLASIVARATPLCERITAPPAAPTDPSPEAARRLERWADRLGGDAELARRLDRAGLTEAEALAVLGSTPPAPAVLPRWADVVRRAYTATSGEVPHRPQREGPFVPVYEPLVEHARARLLARLGDAATRLSAEAMEDVEAALLKRLMRIGTRMFYADFSVYRACRSPLADLLGGEDAYAAYVRDVRGGRIWEAFDVYPVVARLMGRVTEFWIDAVAEFVVRLDADLDAVSDIARTGTGVVQRLSVGMSDPHGQGRGVFIVTFEGGGRVVYKPRPVELDGLFCDLVAWVNATGQAPTLMAPRAMPRGEYGWLEFVERADCETPAEVGRFYERTGALLALAYSLNGADFHLENLIASGEHPVLIDMEALLGHRFRVDDDETAPMRQASQTSVLRVGMLPMLRFGEGGVTANIGGIGGSLEADRPIEILDFKRANSGAMKLTKRRVTLSTDSFNVARLRGEETQALTYVDEIVRGFEATYDAILHNRERFAARVAGELGGRAVRVLIRNTSLYGSAIERSLHPKYLRSGLDHGIELDQLARPFLQTDEAPILWPVAADEQRSMADLDIPLFEAPSDSYDLPVGSSGPIANAFEATAEAETLERIASLSDEDRAMQARIIRGAFEANESRGFRSRPSHSSAAHADVTELGVSPQALVEAAARIGDAVRGSMLGAAADVPVWFTAHYNPDSGRYTLEPAGYGIADGLGGFALFFAALDALAPYRGFGHVALGAAQPLVGFVDRLERNSPIARLPDPGAGTGLGAVAYALSRTGTLLNERSLLDAAKRAARFLVVDAVLGCERPGLVAGRAGALVALTSILDPAGEPDLLDRVRLLTTNLVEAVEGGDVSAGGFAEGAAGVAFALRRALPFAADPDRVRRATVMADQRAAAAAASEEMAYADREAAWAEGRVGRILSQPDAAPIAGAPWPAAVGAPSPCADDTPACGSGAYVELALAIGAHDDARRLAARAAARAETGWGGHAELGFYRGLAGIGYQALRAAAPDRVPSVLTWA